MTHPQLQITVSQQGLQQAADSYDRWNDSRMEIAQQVIEAALAFPPSITEHELEVLTRALLMTYSTPQAWANANRRDIVLGILLSLGITVSQEEKT